jgi:hypothetical protein
MTTYFDQKGQNVHGPQTNIVSDVGQVNVGAISDQAGLLSELERLKAMPASAAQRERSSRSWRPRPSIGWPRRETKPTSSSPTGAASSHT